jgi:hypothetical protein
MPDEPPITATVREALLEVEDARPRRPDGDPHHPQAGPVDRRQVVVGGVAHHLALRRRVLGEQALVVAQRGLAAQEERSGRPVGRVDADGDVGSRPQRRQLVRAGERADDQLAVTPDGVDRDDAGRPVQGGVAEPGGHGRVEEAPGDRRVEQAEVALREAGHGIAIIRGCRHELLT